MSESDRSPLQELLDRPREWWKTLLSFKRTRSAVLAGQSLYDLSGNELKDRELLGPWKFNFFQSALAATPSWVMYWILPNPPPEELMLGAVAVLGVSEEAMHIRHLVGSALLSTRYFLHLQFTSCNGAASDRRTQQLQTAIGLGGLIYTLMDLTDYGRRRSPRQATPETLCCKITI